MTTVKFGLTDNWWPHLSSKDQYFALHALGHDPPPRTARRYMYMTFGTNWSICHQGQGVATPCRYTYTWPLQCKQLHWIRSEVWGLSFNKMPQKCWLTPYILKNPHRGRGESLPRATYGPSITGLHPSTFVMPPGIFFRLRATFSSSSTVTVAQWTSSYWLC